MISLILLPDAYHHSRAGRNLPVSTIGFHALRDMSSLSSGHFLTETNGLLNLDSHSYVSSYVAFPAPHENCASDGVPGARSDTIEVSISLCRS